MAIDVLLTTWESVADLKAETMLWDWLQPAIITAACVRLVVFAIRGASPTGGSS